MLDDAILTAAIDIIRESGFRALTMESVAARAGTNKNTVYRRWTNRVELGIAAYGELTASVPAPDEGSLREDVLALLRGANQHWSSPAGELLRDLVASSGGAPELLKKISGASLDPPETWVAVVRRAVARGEASQRALHPRVAGVPLALLRHEFLLRGVATVPDDVLVEITDMVFMPLVEVR